MATKTSPTPCPRNLRGHSVVGGADKLTIWVSNQASYMDSVVLTHIMGRKVAVRSIGGPCGGSFGSKFMSWQVQCYAALLSRARESR